MASVPIPHITPAAAAAQVVTGVAPDHGHPSDEGSPRQPLVGPVAGVEPGDIHLSGPAE